MSAIQAQTTVGQLLTERPSRARVFEQFGIDYCCGGQQTLAQACAKQNLDLDRVVHALEASDAEHTDTEEIDWSKATITQLLDHIMETHHEYLRTEMPRLTGIVNKVAEVHGERHPELVELRRVFESFGSEIASHLMKEEQVLFPFARQLEQSEALQDFHCGSLQNPIRVMIFEHEDAGAALGKMRALTDDFTLPEDGCNTYRAMLDGLKQLETDMHWHIHKENNILFPAVVEMEQERASEK